ncbi:RIP metalloprotease RseP [Lysobacteraceae bacterium NML75-0749]|nr:RIP metalloprotease RseP [Xanthomonadaceae bacterium NML75-0749]PJK04987.1 RIP metalloprotease RseP [Xanthomonadaceae bacterium NML91-0268]
MSVLGPVFWLIVSLGILVTIHEFGHFWVARRCGVKVLRFSVGFGKPLWLRRGRDGTEYAIAAIPLGGYVRMLDEREAAVDAAELNQAFNRKPLGQRAAIVAAGPLANLGLCVALLWLMFMVGRPDYAPEIGRVQGIAAESGLQRGDVIQSIKGEATPTWSEAGLALLTAALDRAPTAIEVRDAQGHTRQRTLHLERLPAQVKEREAITATGIVPAHHLLAPIVGQVSADAPAAGKLKSGDRILAINGRDISDFTELPPHINKAGEAGQSLALRIARGERTQVVDIRPAKLHHPERGDYWGIGISLPDAMPPPAKNATLRHGPLAAIPAALGETWRLTRQSFAMMVRMVQGRASLENISGPITIARVADRSADMGLAWFLSFLALISLSLAIINLLPIPVLDGGHLLYYLIELVKGSPPSERFMVIGQFIGLAVLACLMGLAFYNDIHGLLR